MPFVLLALVGVGTVVLVGVQEVVLRVLGAGTGREGLGVERALDAPGDLLGGDRLAVLPRRVVTDRERPLGEVLVGACPGRSRGPGRGSSRRTRCRGRTGSATRCVSACWIELPVTDQPLVGSRSSGPGSSGRYTVMVPPGRSALDLGRGALALWVLRDGLRSILEALAAGAATGLVVVPAAATTGSEGHERGTGGECCRRLGPSHCPAFRCCSHTGSARVTSVEVLRLSGGSSGRTRLEPRRRGG